MNWLARWVMHGDGGIGDRYDLVDRRCPHQTRAEFVLACICFFHERACLHIPHCLLWCLVQRESSTTASQEDANLCGGLARFKVVRRRHLATHGFQCSSGALGNKTMLVLVF